MKTHIPPNLLKLVEASLSADVVDPGANEAFVDGRTDRKILPWTVFAQAYDGAYSLSVENEHKVMIETGGAFFAPANRWLTIGHHARQDKKFPPKKRHMKARWLHLHFTIFGTLDFLSLFEIPRLLSSSQAKPFGDLVVAMLGLSQIDPIRAVVARKQRAFEFLSLLIGISRLKPGALPFFEKSGPLAPVLSHIRSHLFERFESADLAKAAGLSVSHLHALFKKQIGTTPMDYVKSLRLDQARLRLGAGRDKIAVIADETGFGNAFHFSRAFKERFGISPKDFRTLDHHSV